MKIFGKKRNVWISTLVVWSTGVGEASLSCDDVGGVIIFLGCGNGVFC